MQPSGNYPTRLASNRFAPVFANGPQSNMCQQELLRFQRFTYHWGNIFETTSDGRSENREYERTSAGEYSWVANESKDQEHASLIVSGVNTFKAVRQDTAFHRASLVGSKKVRNKPDVPNQS